MAQIKVSSDVTGLDVKTNRKGASGELFILNRSNTKAIDLHLYGDVGPSFFGGVSSADIADALKGKKNYEVNLRINSPGGDVFEGLAIYNLLRSHPGTVNVTIDSLAASIATIIALAGDTVTMASEGFFMIHSPWTFAIGNADELAETIERLEATHVQLVRIYERHSSLSGEEIDKMMRDETWLTPEEACNYGFVDKCDDDKERMAAAFTGMSEMWLAKKPETDSMALAKQRLAKQKAALAKLDQER